MARNFNMGVDQDDIVELLEVVSEELTVEELLEQEQERIAEEGVRGKGNCRRRKRRTP